MRNIFFGCLFILQMGWCIASASEYGMVKEETCSTYEVRKNQILSDGDSNYNQFILEVTESGKYHIEAWILPSRYVDGTYSSFEVIINNSAPVTLQMYEGNWQAVKVSPEEGIWLQEGTNTLTFITSSPAIPQVEFVRASLSAQAAALDVNSYESYLSETCEGSFEDDYEFEYSESSSLQDLTPSSVYVFMNLPLRYSFYSSYTFNVGNEVTFSTTSSIGHSIDVFYCGEPISFNRDSLLVGPFTNRSLVSIKPLSTYTPASSEEMQGLNWRGPSEYDWQVGKEKARVRFKVPKSGKYMIRLRSAVNGQSGVADLNVNGTWNYEDVPINCCLMPCVMPSNLLAYASMACSSMPGDDDPMLFIHGADGDRIVGYNDDAEHADTNSLGQYDSYIEQHYLVETSGVSVSSYSSYSPVSTCNITAGIPLSQVQTMRSMISNALPPRKEDMGKKEAPCFKLSEGSLVFSPDNEIDDVIALDLTGNMVGRSKPTPECTRLSFGSLGLSCPGVYLLKIKSGGKMYVDKVMIK